LDLSIIIVNYKVKYLLAHCLKSVAAAVKGINAEVIVVDNDSQDGSVEFLRPLFPDVLFIASNTNLGFGKANNLALKQATGRYILFLNPDTLVSEDTFTICLQYFKLHPNAGAVGVRMIDGAGEFLKESKRAFPSVKVSLFKLMGLSRIFPKSKVFAQYHLGHLSPYQNHVVDVLAGAFMMVRKDVLDKIGAFDEQFFMYGEDIDLSYRIQQNGYENHFLATTSIIHFKGESTKRGSINYVKMFYEAMHIFVKKHFAPSQAGAFKVFIQMGIAFRAMLSSIKRFVNAIGLQLFDMLLIVLCIWGVKLWWFANIRPDVKYNKDILWVAAASFSIVYVVTGFINGLYDKPYRQSQMTKSAIAATLVVLAIYAVLPEQYRFSRGIIVLSAGCIYATLTALRWALINFGLLDKDFEKTNNKQTLGITSSKGYTELLGFLQKSHKDNLLLTNLSPEHTPQALVKLKNDLGFREVIFNINEATYKQTIDIISYNKGLCKYKFYHPAIPAVIGSDGATAYGTYITAQVSYALDKESVKRVKYITDFIIAVFALLASPVVVLFYRKRWVLLRNAIKILSLQYTWVGYFEKRNHLPTLKKALYASNTYRLDQGYELSEEVTESLDQRYAEQYSFWCDIMILYRVIKKQ
jgi:O-antigen biosynthesis protein